MECEKVRDQFSSLLENELDPEEERTVRDHLASCPDCQKDFQQFEKTIRWLHSVEDLKVPEEFLTEIHKKMEERKRKAPFFSPSLKLPAQAVAMVVIVFLVLYLSRIMPFETFQMRGAKEMRPSASEPVTSEPITEERKADPLLAKKEEAKKRVPTQPSLEEAEKGKTPASEAIPAPPEQGKTEPPILTAREKASPSIKPPQEIVLRTSDREKTLDQIQILLQQFKGKMITTEGNVFLVSLPAGSFSEFEKQLLGPRSLGKTEQLVKEKDMVDRDAAPAGAMRLKAEEQVKKPSKLTVEEESHVTVRVLMLEAE